MLWGTVSASCSPNQATEPVPSSTVKTPTTLLSPPDDMRSASFAASLEALAIWAYRGAIQIVNAGQVDAPAEAVARLAATAAAHHEEHLRAWNEILLIGGRPEVTEPDPSLQGTLTSLVQGTHSVGLGGVSVSVEQLLAASYVSATPRFGDAVKSRLAGSIQLVELQHLAVGRFLLDRPLLSGAFANDALSLGSTGE